MRKIIFTSIFFLVSATVVWGASDNVTQLVFITPPLTVAPGVLSEVLSVQTQNSSGAAEPVSETNHLVLTTSSPTGQFMTSTGNPLTSTNVYTSTGNAKRSFNYQDSVAGTYTITVSSVEHPSWVATQSITIGAGDGGTPPVDDNDTNSSSSGGGQTLSTHASPTIQSQTSKPTVAFSVQAGRARLSTIQTPIRFRATATEGSGSIYYTWSFGDGGQASGDIANHTYLFPGHYTVVLNARSGDEEAVSRTEVEVFEPKMEISRINSADGLQVTVANVSKEEVNLGGWGIKGNPAGAFVFPADTIIAKGRSIIFPASITKLTQTPGRTELNLVYPTGAVAAAFVSGGPLSPGANDSLLRLGHELVRLRAELLKLHELL